MTRSSSSRRFESARLRSPGPAAMSAPGLERDAVTAVCGLARSLPGYSVRSEASGNSRTVLRSFEENSVFCLTRRVVKRDRFPAAVAATGLLGQSPGRNGTYLTIRQVATFAAGTVAGLYEHRDGFGTPGSPGLFRRADTLLLMLTSLAQTGMAPQAPVITLPAS
jgi:hypothetical protein